MFCRVCDSTAPCSHTQHLPARWDVLSVNRCALPSKSPSARRDRTSNIKQRAQVLVCNDNGTCKRYCVIFFFYGVQMYPSEELVTTLQYIKPVSVFVYTRGCFLFSYILDFFSWCEEIAVYLLLYNVTYWFYFCRCIL